MSSWSASLPADNSKLRVSAAYIRNNASTLQMALSATTLNGGIDYIPDSGNATPAPIWFYLDAAPAGWQLTAMTGDALLAVKGGSSAYNTTGGTQVGTWTGPNATLIANQLPASIPADRSTAAGVNNWFAVSTSSGQVINQGGGSNSGQPHHHDYTTTRPMANLGIICTKLA